MRYVYNERSHEVLKKKITCPSMATWKHWSNFKQGSEINRFVLLKYHSGYNIENEMRKARLELGRLREVGYYNSLGKIMRQGSYKLKNFNKWGTWMAQSVSVWLQLRSWFQCPRTEPFIRLLTHWRVYLSLSLCPSPHLHTLALALSNK